MIPIRAESPGINTPPMTWLLIGANVAVFGVQLALPADQAKDFLHTYALVPAFLGNADAARQLGFEPGGVLSLLTSLFMHAGFLHLALNMWMLWLFGGPLEDRLGSWRFLALYLISGVLGDLMHLAVFYESAVPVLGASGAIAGVLGAYTLAYPKARVTVVQPIFFFPLTFRLPALAYTGIWLLFQVLSGLAELADPAAAQSGGIAWFVHIGGFAAGIGLGALLGARRGSLWEGRYQEEFKRHPPLTRARMPSR